MENSEIAFDPRIDFQVDEEEDVGFDPTVEFSVEEDSGAYPKKEEMIDVPKEEKEPEEQTVDTTTQYMMGLLSKTNDEKTHMDNALRVFNKNGYEMLDRKKTAGLGVGDPDTYKFKLKRTDDENGEEVFWLDEGSFRQAVWDEVGDVGEYVGGGLGAAATIVAKKPSLFLMGKQAGNAFDQWLSHMITGEELSATDRAKEAGKTAGLSIAELTGGKAVGYVAGKLAGKKIGDISEDAMTIVKETGIDIDDARKILKDVPEKDQAKVIAQQTGGKGYGFMEGAIASDEATRIKYLDELTARKKAIDETAGVQDFPSIKKNTENEYGAMKKYASSIVTDSDGYDLKGYSGRLRELSDLASTNTAKDRIEIIATQLDKYPLSSLEDMIDLRQVINYESRKSASGRAKKQWGEMKDNLDGYMKNTFSPEDMKIVDDSIGSYARMKNQEELIEIISKPSVTKTLGEGSKHGEVGAVNWSALTKELNNAGLNSPEVRNTVKVSKMFMEKFGDIDSKLFNLSTPKGEKDITATLANTLEGAARVMGIRKVVSFAARMASPELQAQHAISQSIKNSDTQAEFVMNVMKNKNTPKAIKERFKTIATKNHLNRASVNRSKFISRKAEESTKKMQDKVQKTSIAIDKKDMSINKIDEIVSKLENKLNKAKTNRGKNTINEKIKIQNNKRVILRKEKQMLERDHADFTKRYDDAVQEVEELSMFSQKKTKGTLAKGADSNAYPKLDDMIDVSPKKKDNTIIEPKKLKEIRQDDSRMKEYIQKREYKSEEEFDEAMSSLGYGNYSISDIVGHIDKNSKGSLNFEEIRNNLLDGSKSYFKTTVDPRTLNIEDTARVAKENVGRTGNIDIPIVVGKDGYVIDGRHRALKSSEDGVTEIEAYIPAKDYYKKLYNKQSKGN